MRLQFAILAIVLGTAAAAADPVELVTAPDAILCLSAENLAAATHPAVAKSQIVLRAMGCMRSQAGIRSRVVRNAPDGAWQVRFYPQGISGGVVLWGRPSSFTAPGGATPAAVERS
jgi:hypothetical protein